MFYTVTISTLKGLSADIIKQLKSYFPLVDGRYSEFPKLAEKQSAVEILESKYEGEGKINISYAFDVLIVLEYCENAQHYLTGENLLEAIISGKRINFGDFHRHK